LVAPSCLFSAGRPVPILVLVGRRHHFQQMRWIVRLIRVGGSIIEHLL
jgi:hypothetical protein